jgi:hypothetical protein
MVELPDGGEDSARALRELRAGESGRQPIASS